MKPGSCSLCSHQQRRAEIDAASVSGVTVRELATRFQVSPTTVQKHVAQHIPASVQKAAADAREVDAGDAILAKLETLTKRVERVLEKLEQKRDHRGMAPFFRELRELLELQARLLGELRDNTVNVVNMQISREQGESIARMYLARSSKSLPTGRSVITQGEEE